MTKLKRTILENTFFLVPYFIVAVIASIFIFYYGKVDIHIYMNHFHSPFFDGFFKYITHLGDGIIAVGISVILLFISYRWAIISAMSSVLIMIIIRFLKKVIFLEWFRPTMFFDYFYKGDYTLYLIEGVQIRGKYSFPSGHSTTAFAIFFLISLMVKNKILKFILFIFALLIAFSRIYLSQHFLQDTIAGSFLGIIITLACYILISKSNNKYLDNSLIKKS